MDAWPSGVSCTLLPDVAIHPGQKAGFRFLRFTPLAIGPFCVLAVRLAIGVCFLWQLADQLQSGTACPDQKPLFPVTDHHHRVALAKGSDFMDL